MTRFPTHNRMIALKPLERLRELSGFLLDMDGTMYLGDQLFPFSIPFLERLRALDKRRLWLTNNCSKTPGDYVAKLGRMGIAAEEDDIFTSGHAAIAWLDARQPGARLYALGTPSFEAQLQAAGFVLTADRPDYVLASFDLGLTYEKLRTACDLVQRGVPFLATHPDKVCPTETLPIPDCGAICAAITAATGTEPLFFGKPAKEMAKGALARLGTAPGSTAMVGDRLSTDIMMARDAGMVSILVLTGEAQREDLAQSPVQPDYVFESVGELGEVLDGKQPKQEEP